MLQFMGYEKRNFMKRRTFFNRNRKKSFQRVCLLLLNHFIWFISFEFKQLPLKCFILSLFFSRMCNYYKQPHIINFYIEWKAHTQREKEKEREIFKRLLLSLSFSSFIWVTSKLKSLFKNCTWLFWIINLICIFQIGPTNTSSCCCCWRKIDSFVRRTLSEWEKDKKNVRWEAQKNSTSPETIKSIDPHNFISKNVPERLLMILFKKCLKHLIK